MRWLPLILLLLACALPASAASPRVLASQDVDPVWSPDGTRIAFTRVYADRDELEVFDLRSHRVWQIATNRYKLLPSWSPDGRWIAYQAGGAIWQVDGRPYGGRGARLTGRGQQAFSPVWATHDPETIAYLTTLSARNTDLWTLTLTGDGIERQLVAKDVIGVPAWSLDGRLAFQRDDGIYVDDRLVARVANPGAPAWSHDGTKLAYAVANRVWVVPADGSGAPGAVSKPFADIGRPSWSHDDTKIAFQHRGGLDVVTPAGAAVAAHESPELFRADVSFAPKSDWLAYSDVRASCPGHRGIARRFGSTSVVLTGSCAVTGTPGADAIEGTPRENDVIAGGAGDDRIHANDGYTDRVDCGAGRDTVWADRQDRLRGCERVL